MSRIARLGPLTDNVNEASPSSLTDGDIEANPPPSTMRVPSFTLASMLDQLATSHDDEPTLNVSKEANRRLVELAFRAHAEAEGLDAPSDQDALAMFVPTPAPSIVERPHPFILALWAIMFVLVALSTYIAATA
jgi:hypothetical protein